MVQLHKLAAFFLPHAPKRVTLPTDPAVLELLLQQAWEKARSGWPDIVLPPEDFATYLAHSLAGAEGLLGDLLEKRHLSDLYLADACMKDVPNAREALDTHYLAQIGTRLGSLRLPADALDEIRQTLRIHLLMGTPRAGPRLATYTGEGSLESWIRVSAVRIAIRQGAVARETPEEKAPALFEAIPSQQPDAEFDLILRRYGPEFRQAYEESLSELPDEQKLLLQMHYIEKVSTTNLGALFGVDQSTISRKLKAAREAVHEATKRRLKERLKLSSHEFESLFAALRSRLDASISQILEEDHEKEMNEEEGERKEEGGKKKKDGEHP